MNVTTSETLCVNQREPALHRFEVVSDPSHGWLAVPISLVREVGVYASVSSYSFKSSEIAYLEEDCDAGLFLDAYISKYGLTPDDIKFVESHVDYSAPCRALPRF